MSILIWEALCLALLWSVFCRLVRTSTATRLSVRVSIFSLGLASLIGIAAPLYGWVPDSVIFIMTVACLNMQLVAARHWRKGVPEQFQTSVFNVQRKG